MHCFIHGSARVIFQIVAVFRRSTFKGLTNSVKNILTVYLYIEKHDIFPRFFASFKTQSTLFCRKGITRSVDVHIYAVHIVHFNIGSCIFGRLCSDSQVNNFITLTQQIYLCLMQFIL